METDQQTLTAEELTELQVAFEVADARMREAQLAGARFEAAQAGVRAAAYLLMARKGLSPDNWNVVRRENGEITLQPVSDRT